MTYRDVGRVRIYRLVETERTGFEPRVFFPAIAEDQWEPYRSWLQPRAWDPISDQLVLCVQSFVLRTPTKTIVVDTCVGDHKKRWRAEWSMTSSGVFLDRLAELGLSPEQVDHVICTHMHADHVGWNTHLVNGSWLPTFPNATYLLAKQEWLAWKSRHDIAPVDQIGDSVLPIVESGRSELIEDGYQITEEVSLAATPGHTPGHQSVWIRSDGALAVITGDVIQHPVQCREPGWNTVADADQELASRTRRALLEDCSRTGALVCASHFPAPSFGHVVPRKGRFDFVYDEDAHPSIAHGATSDRTP